MGAEGARKEKVRHEQSYTVPAETFAKVFNFTVDEWVNDKKSSGWREFFSQYKGPKLVNQSHRSNNKSGTVFAKHGKVKGKPWCASSFNFSIRKPLDGNATEFVFTCSMVNVGNCDCVVNVGAVPVDPEGPESIDCKPLFDT